MSFFDRIKKGLEKTKKGLIQNIESIVIGYAHIDEEFLDDLEMILVSGDLGVRTTDYLMRQIRRGVKEGDISNTSEVMPFIEKTMIELLTENDEKEENHVPEVYLIVGVNGVGKTTTIGKLAYQMSKAGKKVLLAAGDTYRAAASEQLTIWAERTGSDIVKHAEGADPAAVAFDALTAAKARNADVVLVDTAGRIQTKTNLMNELGKINKVMKKVIPDAPHQTLLVLDATTGQNAVSQAKHFKEVVDITGIVLTKLDGTAKGGVVLSIHEELKVPVKWIGLGEREDDLQKFDASVFVKALFENSEQSMKESTKI
ncbi:signal recognition particle-docking protein FtsY [Dialister micraerophilus]|uniref:signal recognition particle-docking protein FtsY n=1 Tax=Dialister micraerophilus TaxID=309120 RepID=UPI0023F0E94B|nr:signal recognition particle-docking protein FtsY [Dialister micraerophilus]MDK8253871.1 signal recognition particle-docking protein FtsY [Dialister micraerophilus]MDK8285780.1 signal recognition particle-docking protein FtsY [Dialister micraerophilus]MDU5301909.1 signal recognition particle-docking protein FtsY [Dialister micraerophilus]